MEPASPFPSPGAAVACAALLACLASCGPASPGPASPAPSASASASPSSTAEPDASATPTTSAAPTAEPAASATPAAPAKPGVPVDSSSPPGVNPLSDAEASELKTKCKKLTDEIASAARKDHAKKRPIDYVEEILAKPPKLAGVDVPRCSELIRRDTVDYLARTRESEAKINLKRIVVGFVTALGLEPPVFCPSAKAVPPDPAAVKDQPYSSSPADWQAPGWKCVRLDLSGAPQVFQYEIKSDPKAQTFEAIARGYPVKGAAPTELYIAGKVDHGAIDPSMPILRRQ